MAIKALVAVAIMLGGCAVQTGPDADAIRNALTPSRLAAIKAPLLLVTAPETDLAATLVPVAQNGPVQTWRTGDGVQLSLHAGVIVATRGLGDDMMTSDATGLRRALGSGGGTYSRKITRLDGDFGTQFETWHCTLRLLGRQTLSMPLADIVTVQFEEECRGVNDGFTNQYALSRDGVVWASRQWVGPDVGYLQVSLLKR